MLSFCLHLFWLLILSGSNHCFAYGNVFPYQVFSHIRPCFQSFWLHGSALWYTCTHRMFSWCFLGASMFTPSSYTYFNFVFRSASFLSLFGLYILFLLLFLFYGFYFLVMPSGPFSRGSYRSRACVCVCVVVRMFLGSDVLMSCGWERVETLDN